MLSAEELRDSVRRELGALLNSTALSTVQDLSAYPNVQRSTLNYGMPDMSGKTASGIDPRALESLVVRALAEFEPRLVKDTVKVAVNRTDQMSHNTVTFVIEAELWSKPLPQKLLLRTELELESGEVFVHDTVR